MDTKQINTIDLSYLEATFGGNKTIINKILNSFMDNTPRLLEELEDKIAKNSWGEVKMIAHKIKSSFNTIGAKNVGELLGRIELETSNDDKLNISLLINQVKSISDNIFNAIASELNK